jgi:hypothetical protein
MARPPCIQYPGAAYQLRRRMKERLTHDTALARTYRAIDRKLKKMLNVEI